MEQTQNFNQMVFLLSQEKTSFFDNSVLPSVVAQYRIIETCQKTITEYLQNKSLIQADPYKLDKKISDIQPIDAGDYLEAEKEMVLGLRLSDYDNMLNFICNYYKLCIANLTLDNLKKFSSINSCFLWNAFSAASPDTNTKLLATALTVFKQTADTVTIGIVTDCIARASKALTNINDVFKQVGDFQRELYKAKVRKNVLESDAYKAQNITDAKSSLEAIRKCFSKNMTGEPFYADLITEITQEDFAPNKDALRQQLLQKLQVSKKDTEKKEKQIDTKDLIMQSALLLGGLSSTLLQTARKIQENHNLLEAQNNTIFQKLLRAIRKVLGIKEPACIYELIISDPKTLAKKIQRIEYQKFLSLVQDKVKFFSNFTTKDSIGAKKLESIEEKKISDFIAGQIVSMNPLLQQLSGLDDFFKRSVFSSNKGQIKGLKMEITLLKNTLAKVAQKRADYNSIAEEKEQMKKLGIS